MPEWGVINRLVEVTVELLQIPVRNPTSPMGETFIIAINLFTTIGYAVSGTIFLLTAVWWRNTTQQPAQIQPGCQDWLQEEAQEPQR